MIELRNFVKNIKPYKPGKAIEDIAREQGLTGEILKLASNENPLGPPPTAVAALKKSLNKLNIYPDDNCFHLKHRLSTKYKIPINQIIIGNGSVELIELIFKAYVNPGDEVIMSEPSFIMYKIACQIFGGKMVSIPLVDFKHNIEKITQAINTKTKIIIIDNPINPTGTIITKEQFDQFIKKIPDHVILVIDEAYNEYIEDEFYPKAPNYLLKHSNLIALHTFSKIYGLAGLRIGYGFSSPDIITALMKVRLPFNVNRAGQAAASAALDDKDFVKKSIANNEEGKKFFYKELKKLGLEYVPTYGNFIMVEFSKEAMEIFNLAQKRGVILRTIYEYGLSHHLRITIGTPQQNERVIRVLKEII